MTDDRDDEVAPLIAPTSRHPGDMVRLVAGAAVLAVSVLAVYRDRVSVFETNLFRLGNDLPAAIEPYLNVIMQAGNVVAAPVLAAITLVIGRLRYWRAAFDVALAGTLAWFAAKLVKDTIQRPRPGGLLDDVARFGPTEGLGFASGHTAVAAALACAIAPYLPRYARRAVWTVPWLVGLGRIYFGAHLPLDIIGGAAVGWMIGAAIHLALGAPHGAPTLDRAAEVIRSAGWDPREVRRVAGDHLGSFPFVAALDRGSVFVKLLDPDTRDRDLLIRLARFLSFRDVRDEAAVLDAPAQANREAAVTLLAQRNGVRAPTVLAIAREPRQRGRVWLALEHVPSRDLSRAEASDISDAFLHDLWSQVARLRDAGIAHRELVAPNILVDEEQRPWIVDFAHADSSARPHAFANDVAELLVTTALLVGPERAVDAAVAALGRDIVAEAHPELAPLALTPQTRRELRRRDPAPGGGERRFLLDELRGLVATHRPPAAGAPSRRTGAPGWPRLATALGSLVLVLAASVTVAGPGEVGDALETVRIRWLGVALVAWAISSLSSTVALIAAVERRLAIGRTALVTANAAAVAASAGSRRSVRVIADQLAQAGVPDSVTSLAVTRARRAAWVSWVAVGVAALIDAIDADQTLVEPDDLATFAALAVLAIMVHLGLSRLGSDTAVTATINEGDRATTGLGVAGWVPILVAQMVSVITAVAAFLAIATAVPVEPAPLSYAAVIGIGAWGSVRLPPIGRAVALRPALVTLGLAVSGAALPMAVGVAVIVGSAEFVGSILGAVAARSTNDMR